MRERALGSVPAELYSESLGRFLRFRLRASAALVRFFSPGLR
jgi:hypothetical protein